MFHEVMEYYRIPLYILFGILPSLIWLFYYLKKDLHPEPKKMILKVFLLGALVTIPVFFLQVGLSRLLGQFQDLALFENYPIFIEIVKWFIIIAFTEELAKYVVVKLSIFGTSTIDEPLDIMLYMVVSALGFAAAENILYLFSPIDSVSFGVILQSAVMISFVRFIGATFLHTLCSALLGYFWALSSLKNNHRFILTFIGIILATLLHGLYNFSIITLPAPFNIIIPLGVIIILTVGMIYDFKGIRKIKSVCKIVNPNHQTPMTNQV